MSDATPIPAWIHALKTLRGTHDIGPTQIAREIGCCTKSVRRWSKKAADRGGTEPMQHSRDRLLRLLAKYDRAAAKHTE